MDNSIHFNGYEFSPDYLSQDDEDLICKKLSCSEFSQLCTLLSYQQICQINDELNLRAGKIRRQIDSRSGDMNWRTKVNTAISIIDQKIAIVSNRIRSIQNNNISSLVERLGGINEMHGKRLALIKCLVFIIDNHCQISKLNTNEKSIIDMCRSVSGSVESDISRDFRYDVVRNSIVSSSGVDVATLCSFGVDMEEHGYRMARSWDLLNLIDRIEPVIKSVAPTFRDDTVDRLHSEVVNILTELK